MAPARHARSVWVALVYNHQRQFQRCACWTFFACRHNWQQPDAVQVALSQQELESSEPLRGGWLCLHQAVKGGE
ncbi:hypothetical protein H6F76_03200 [Leptolyngbya sp. FACHB-321]|uniref:hypothetical protein n=1 Tax=Leptolyngbya sp. FACHB-321 TaxID=2692807 RepID=UPI00198DA855|nr:hypothetical protein [Leptolyngbya sp. FACHB-321]MBD2034057.1 hypothetical protein [Leptolyngbya sp. FACHB-321]